MKSYMFGDSNNEININTYSFADIDYNNFWVKEVLLKGEPTGEYHIKCKNDSTTPKDLAEVLRMVLDSNDKVITLNTPLVDYDVTIKISDPQKIDEIMSEID